MIHRVYKNIPCVFLKGVKKMKVEWTWIISILFAVIIAVFSVMNVEPVLVNYVFGTAQWPLVLVILGSALLGAAISGFFALFRAYKARHELKELKKELNAKEMLIATQQNEIEELKKQLPQVLERQDKKQKLEMNETIIDLEAPEKIEK